jgi:hypothetical protein
MPTPMADAFYVPDGERFVPTELTRGPWDPGAQHAGPPAALLGRAIERCEPKPDALVGRITFEILGPVPLGPIEVAARVTRGGRSVELIEATLRGPDREAMRASAWRLRTTRVDAAAAGSGGERPPGPGAGESRPFFPTGESVGYHTAMEYRFVAGGFLEPGPAVVWMRPRHPLVEGERLSPLGHVLIAADSGNGVSAALDYRRYLFINTDLTVHLLRTPATEWVCLDAVTYVEPHGIGLTETVLWDEEGRIGRGAQELLVRAR